MLENANYNVSRGKKRQAPPVEEHKTHSDWVLEYTGSI